MTKLTKNTQFIGEIFGVLRRETIISRCERRSFVDLEDDWESRKSSEPVTVIIARTETIERTRSILGVEDVKGVALLAGTGLGKRIEG